MKSVKRQSAPKTTPPRVTTTTTRISRTTYAVLVRRAGELSIELGRPISVAEICDISVVRGVQTVTADDLRRGGIK